MTSSTQKSPHSHPNMLLAYPTHLTTGGPHQTAIRTPPRLGSPKLASLSLAESSAKPISSSGLNSLLIMDQQGEIHDPSYLSTLRSLHAEIGARASPQPGRRPSSHIPSRPSMLGLGLSGRDVDQYHHSFSSSDDDDSDSDDDNDLDNLNSYNSVYRSSSLSSSSRLQPTSSTFSSVTPPRSPQFPPVASTRHMSISTDKAEPISSKDKNRRASWAPKKKDFEASKSEDWGFTGIVDLEREQRVARESLDQSRAGIQQTEVQEASNEPSSRSMRRKGSAASSADQHGDKENQSKSFGLSLHPSTGKVGSWLTGSKDHSLRKPSSLSSLKGSRYGASNSENLGLSTIISGRQVQDDISNSDQWSAASDPQVREFGKPTNRMAAQLQEQQQDADFIVGPSKYKQSKDTIKKKAHEWGDTSTQAYEFRRKMENMALGVRFGAFKAKRRLERGLKE